MGEKTDAHNEHINKQIEKIFKKNQSEINNSTVEIKNTIQGMKSTLSEIERSKWLKDKIMEMSHQNIFSFQK